MTRRRRHPDFIKSQTNPLYVAWYSMISRCNKTYSATYKYNSKKNVQVCVEWQNSFYAFVIDMGPKPDPSYQLDRINNNGDYCPKNCRWVTPSQNRRNRPTSPTYTRTTQAERDAMIAMRLAGSSVTDIAVKFNRAPTGVSKMLTKAGVQVDLRKTKKAPKPTN